MIPDMANLIDYIFLVISLWCRMECCDATTNTDAENEAGFDEGLILDNS